MKTLFTSFLLLLSLSAHSQGFTIDSLTNKVEYEVVLTQQNTKDELYSRAKQWVSQNFGNSEAVIDLDDKAQGQLFIEGETIAINKVEFEGSTVTRGIDIAFNMRLYLKDNKYKVVVDNIETRSGDGYSTPIDVNRLQATRNGKPVMYDGDAVVVSEKAIAKIVASLQTFLASKPESDF